MHLLCSRIYSLLPIIALCATSHPWNWMPSMPSDRLVVLRCQVSCFLPLSDENTKTLNPWPQMFGNNRFLIGGNSAGFLLCIKPHQPQGFWTSIFKVVVIILPLPTFYNSTGSHVCTQTKLCEGGSADITWPSISVLIRCLPRSMKDRGTDPVK